MRAQIRLQQTLSGDLVYRVTESDGGPIARWLPTGPLLGALDRGGFLDFDDARSFALGVDQVRAEAGLIEVPPQCVNQERARPHFEAA